MNTRTLTKEQLDQIAILCGNIGKDGEEVFGIDVEFNSIGKIVGFRVATTHPIYKSKWIKLNEPT